MRTEALDDDRPAVPPRPASPPLLVLAGVAGRRRRQSGRWACTSRRSGRRPSRVGHPPDAAPVRRRRARGALARRRRRRDRGPAPAPRPMRSTPRAELARIRADVDFWAARLAARPAGHRVRASSSPSPTSREARMTGDVTAYLARRAAADAALAAQPELRARARPCAAAILVCAPPVRRGARPRAGRSSPATPDDPTALGVLGDASPRARRPRDGAGRPTARSRSSADGVRVARPRRRAWPSSRATRRRAVAARPGGRRGRRRRGPRGRRARVLRRHPGRDAARDR